MSQSERCRRILAELSQRPEEDGGSPYTRLPISALVEAAAAQHQQHGVRLIFATAGAPIEDEPQVRRSPEIMHGLNNLIQNAVQFARSRSHGHHLLGPGDGHGRDQPMTGRGFCSICWAASASPICRPAPAPPTIWGSASSSRRACWSAAAPQLAFDNLEEGGAHVAISWNRANLETSDKIRQPAASAHAHR